LDIGSGRFGLLEKDQLDFIFTVNSGRYFSPKIFEEVVRTATKYLVPRGTFMAYYFIGNLPWSIGGYNNGFNTAASCVAARQILC